MDKTIAKQALSMLAGVLLARALGAAEPAVDPVAELLKVAPEAKEFALLFSADCFTGNDKLGKKYLVNNLRDFAKAKLAKVGYYLHLVGNDGKVSWVFATVDPFMDKVADYSFPRYWPKFPPIQKQVKNLTVKSNVAGVKTGTFPGGNVEIWLGGMKTANSAKVPGASDDTFDFGDEPTEPLSSVFQLHNTGEKQTVFSVNRWFLDKKNQVDIGIGNAPSGHPDWTGSRAGKNYRSAHLLILLQEEL
jgi:sialate O-acetylesterase